MLSDETVQRLLVFRRDRDWEQFHSPKNLAIAMSVEAGEVLEHFQWTSEQGLPETEGASVDSLALELADVTMVLVYLAHDLRVDLDAAVRSKLDTNELRYPVAKSRGRSAKYNRLK